VLPAVEGLVADGSVKRLLVIGVGCQIQALRAIEPLLGLERLYVLGTNCADNGPRGGLDKFLDAASAEPGRVTHYEFAQVRAEWLPPWPMRWKLRPKPTTRQPLATRHPPPTTCPPPRQPQDYRVHLRRDDGAYERIPYFCLPAAELSTGVIAPSCLSCFDYSNSLADLVVGYMGVPLDPKTPMHAHQGYLTVRNARGEEMLAAAGAALELSPTESRPGLFSRAMLAWQTALADDQAKTGGAPAAGAPRWLGELLATLLTWLGPSGLEFAAYSIDYHALRNWVHVRRHWGAARADAHVPPSAKLIVEEYDRKGAVSARAALAAPFPGARLEERE
jgi:7-hydroxymethyl chlorophyll a reductase